MRRAPLVLLVCFAGAPAFAQDVISAKAGLVYHTEGRTFLNQQPLVRDFGRYPQMKDGDIFRTGRGRAEILLAPGVFLRLGARTLIRLISDEIMHSRVELVSGGAVLEAASLRKEEVVTLDVSGTSIAVTGKGLYHLEASPPALRVFKGMVVVASGGRRIEVRKGQELLLDGTWATRKFDRRQTDALDTWSNGRSRQLSVENTLAMWASSQGKDQQDEISDASSKPPSTPSVRRRTTPPANADTAKPRP